MHDLIKNGAKGARRFKRSTWVLALLVLAAIPLVAGFMGSLGKSELGERLAALDKNAAIGELERLDFVGDVGGGPRDLGLVYHHAPRTNGPGPEGAIPILLIHGTPSTLYSWSELIHGAEEGSEGPGFEGLAASHEVYAIEVVGHGVAPDDLAPYTFESCAQFVGAAIRALGLERVHLVGSSYGGEFVWRAALNDPELIESIVLMDSSGVRRREPDWLPEELEMRNNSLAKIGWLINARERIEVALAPHFRGLPPDRVEEFFLVCSNASNWKAMVDLARDENGEREHELSQLKPPTLLLWGADDIAYSLDYYAQRFADEIPNARLIALPETGHYPHEERPAKVVGILNEFFSELASQPGASR